MDWLLRRLKALRLIRSVLGAGNLDISHLFGEIGTGLHSMQLLAILLLGEIND